MHVSSISHWIDLGRKLLTLNVPSKILADNFLKYFFLLLFFKIGLDIACELSAYETIHMKLQVLFFLK